MRDKIGAIGGVPAPTDWTAVLGALPVPRTAGNYPIWILWDSGSCTYTAPGPPDPGFFDGCAGSCPDDY